MSELRRMLKRFLEQSLVAVGGPRILRATRSGDDVILAYHNVTPEGAPPGGDRSLHLSRAAFAEQLDLLAESHRVVSLETLLAGEPEGGSPRAAITFDDGYRGALTVGLAELAAREMPCTVFVPPGLLGSDALWWDAFVPEDRDSLPAAFRDDALERSRGREEEVVELAERWGLEWHPQPTHAGLVMEEELVEAVGRQGVEVGSHSWSHANLARLEGTSLADELACPWNWLRERFGEEFLPWLSLPYGRWSEDVVSAAVETGYRGVLDLSGELVNRSAVSVTRRVPRRNVPAGISPQGFVLATAGL